MITLTPVAGDKLKQLIADEAEPGSGLRVKVVPGGCSGFEYAMTFDQPGDGDEVVEQHGVKVIIDRMSVPYLLGSEFDYEEGFQGAGFRINNPNSTGSCGCGKSFTARAREHPRHRRGGPDAHRRVHGGPRGRARHRPGRAGHPRVAPEGGGARRPGG
jgi:iron-sulfur cluster assembly accessory protein